MKKVLVALLALMIVVPAAYSQSDTTTKKSALGIFFCSTILKQPPVSDPTLWVPY